MRTPIILLLFTLTIPAFALSPSDAYSLVVPGTVQLKYDLLLDPRTVEKPELVNKLLRQFKLKELGSSLNLSSGTGVVVSSDGKIVTNSHVVTLSLEDVLGARKFLIDGFNVMLNRPETTKAFSKSEIDQLVKDLTKLIVQSPATLKVQVNNKETRAVRVIVQDPDLDLALVQSDFVDLVPLKLADSSTLRVGDDVLALGYPLGKTLEDLFLEVTTTMTKGAVSALRSSTLGIQHSASISHGNSGGPLVNQNGEVVGINSAGITEANNLNLAIPANTVKKFLKDTGFGTLVDENARLPEPKTLETPALVKNPTSGQGMIVIQGLTPGTKVTVSNKDPLTVPDDGIFVLQNLPYGEVRISADLPVYDKVYQPYYVYKEKSVLVNGYAPGLVLRLDDTKDYVVPANGILDLPVTFDKPHSLVAQPGWGRGFETTVLVTDETEYLIRFPSGTLSVEGVPQGAQLSLNGKPSGFPDGNGKWVRDFLPVGSYNLGLVADYLTLPPQKVEVTANTIALATVEAKAAGALAIRLGQPPSEVGLVLLGPSGLEIPVEVGQVQMLEPGVYRLQARHLGDEVDEFSQSETLEVGKKTEILVPILAKHITLEEAQRNALRVRLGTAFGIPHFADMTVLAEWDKWKAVAGISVPFLISAHYLVLNFEVAYVFRRTGTWDVGLGIVYLHTEFTVTDSWSSNVNMVGAEIFFMEQGGFFATLGLAPTWVSQTYTGRQTENMAAVLPVVNVGWSWTVWR